MEILAKNTVLAVVSAAGQQVDLAMEWIMNVETHDPIDLDDPGMAGFPSTANRPPQSPRLLAGNLVDN